LDHFILAAQEAQGFASGRDADTRGLIPPALFRSDWVAANAAAGGILRQSKSPDAYAKLSMSCSPRRNWASAGGGTGWNVARYGGKARARSAITYPAAWRYRDWVIRASEADVALR